MKYDAHQYLCNICARFIIIMILIKILKGKQSIQLKYSNRKIKQLSYHQITKRYKHKILAMGYGNQL